MQNGGEDYFFKKKIRVINPKDSRVWTDVTYTKNRENNYTATIRLSDGQGEPYSRTSVTYIAGVKKDQYSVKPARTDKDGKFEVKIDTTMKTIEVEFRDGQPFPFKRYIYIPSQLKDFDVQFSRKEEICYRGIFSKWRLRLSGLTGEPWRPREKCIKIRS